MADEGVPRGRATREHSLEKSRCG